MNFRPYDRERDLKAAARIWREVGWQTKEDLEGLHSYLACGRTLVAELNGEAESLVCTAPGTTRYLGADLATCCVTGVTTGLVARRQGLAGKLLARALAEDAQEGAVIASLGAFDLGYYDRLGFGTGPYEHYVSFDPMDLQVPNGIRARPPLRIAASDWQEMHRARLGRLMRHGNVNVLPEGITRGEASDGDGSFGLGYRDGADGALSHYLWFRSSSDDNGPYHVSWMVYRSGPELLELLGVLHSLADQVHSVRMQEPPGVQMQDFLRTPTRARSVTRSSKHEAEVKGRAYWQVRLLNVEAGVAAMRLPGPETEFNLRLHDPVERFLPEGSAWRGVGGAWTVRLGAASCARPGHAEGLPVLEAGVAAFTRLWLGVLPPSALAAAGALTAPPGLPEALDGVVRLPRPQMDWEF